MSSPPLSDPSAYAWLSVTESPSVSPCSLYWTVTTDEGTQIKQCTFRLTKELPSFLLNWSPHVDSLLLLAQESLLLRQEVWREAPKGFTKWWQVGVTWGAKRPLVHTCFVRFYFIFFDTRITTLPRIFAGSAEIGGKLLQYYSRLCNSCQSWSDSGRTDQMIWWGWRNQAPAIVFRALQPLGWAVGRVQRVR